MVHRTRGAHAEPDIGTGANDEERHLVGKAAQTPDEMLRGFALPAGTVLA